ncbi:MAG: glutamate racemase [Gammaproteobacteria bacterium]
MKTVCVFDSGVGGLSVLRALLADMPEVRFVYLADSARAPYGERGAAWVQERSRQIVDNLRGAFDPDAIVVACNTATALAIDHLRQTHHDLPFVGVEPALKPAALQSRTGQVGVMATRGTLDSARFAALRQRLGQHGQTPVAFHCIACDGLADAIERDDQPAISALCRRYVGEIMAMPAADLAVDTLVLGCTHYPFAAAELQAVAGSGVTLVDTSVPVARRTREILHLGAPSPARQTMAPTLLTTGRPSILDTLARRWLAMPGGSQVWHC